MISLIVRKLYNKYIYIFIKSRIVNKNLLCIHYINYLISLPYFIHPVKIKIKTLRKVLITNKFLKKVLERNFKIQTITGFFGIM